MAAVPVPLCKLAGCAWCTHSRCWTPGPWSIGAAGSYPSDPEGCPEKTKIKHNINLFPLKSGEYSNIEVRIKSLIVRIGLGT
jgi:hypothetical protein